MHSRLIIVYFLLLALLVGALRALDINAGMQGILVAMAIAGLLILAGKLILSAIRRKMASYDLSGKQWLALAFGVAPSAVQVIDAYPAAEGELVSQPYDRQMVLYAGEDEYEYEELPESIIEPGGLPLAATFQPSIQTILGMMIAIFGVRRFGKSNALAVIIEALAPWQLPMLICDTKDEYAGLVNRQYLPHGYMAGAPGASANVPEDVRFYYVSVDEEHAFAFGKSIMDGSLQMVLNLKSYQSDDEAARVMCKIVQGINAWQEARPNAQRVPVEIALDEAHKWLPQQLSESCVSKEVQELLHQTFFSTIVRMGGSYGFGLIVASQRISELDKRCLQSLWQFLFKQTEDIDIQRYETKGLPREEVLSLRQGECFVFCPQALGFRVHLYQKKSPDLSQTPGLEQLAKHSQLAHTKHDMLARKRSYTAVLPQEDEAFLQQATSALARNPDGSARQVPAPILPTQHTRAEDIPIARAIHAWNSGVNTVSRLEQTWGLTNHQARRLRQMILEQGGTPLAENEEQVAEWPSE
jgi:hypothetical protein